MVNRTEDGVLCRWSRLLSVDPQTIAQVYGIERFRKRNKARFERLTERETEVLILLAHGFTNRTIADLLLLSKYTVETHRKHLNNKLEVRSFSDIMKFAIAFRLVDF